MKNLKLKKIIASSLILASALGLSPIEANAEWKRDTNGWWNTDGTSWSVGWKQIDEEWYYFDKSGYMKTGWLLDGDKWYYLNSNGTMAKNTTIDGYSLDSDGVWRQSVKNSSSSSGTSDKELNLNWYEVQKINVSVFPSFFKEFDAADEKQIQKITGYLNSLSMIETKLDPSEYVGGGYSVRVYLKDGSIREFELLCNQFFIDRDRFTYEIPYEEATKFDTIIGNILEENEDKTSESSISGKITSIKAEKSGCDISCVIKDIDNKTYNINVENSKIIDVTGNGWLILHKGDAVKIYYQKGEEVTNDSINTISVYIKNAAGDID